MLSQHHFYQLGFPLTGLFWLGELIEFNVTDKLFTHPQKELTEAYLTGKMG